MTENKKKYNLSSPSLSTEAQADTWRNLIPGMYPAKEMPLDQVVWGYTFAGKRFACIRRDYDEIFTYQDLRPALHAVNVSSYHVPSSMWRQKRRIVAWSYGDPDEMPAPPRVRRADDRPIAEKDWKPTLLPGGPTWEEIHSQGRWT